jgi:hypothetical protein
MYPSCFLIIDLIGAYLQHSFLAICMFDAKKWGDGVNQGAET